MKYAVMLFALVIAFNVFGPDPINELLQKVIAFLPSVIVAMIAIVVAGCCGVALRVGQVHAPQAFESVSTWRQAPPKAASGERSALVSTLAGRVAATSAYRLRVAVDGLTAAGKTSFGHELAAALRALGRPTLRASLDDFKHPWSHAVEHGYDRLTGQGYYRNAYDVAAARDLLLVPAGRAGSGIVVLCAHDPLTGIDHSGTTVLAPADAVLIVDSVFAFRPELDDLWDFRIRLHVDPDLALARGIARDAGREGIEGATRLHRDRYRAAELVYLSEVDPAGVADLCIDNTDFAHPHIRPRPGQVQDPDARTPGAPSGCSRRTDESGVASACLDGC